MNRLVKIIDPLGGTSRINYDNRGNVLSREDPKGGITSYRYDRNSRLLKMTRPLGEETTYRYDALGNRTAVLDSKGQKIGYEYDDRNRLVRAHYYAAGDHFDPVKTVDFSYDNLGRLISYDDGTTSAAYTYDELGRKTEEAVNYGPFTLGYSYAYYANGAKKSFTGPDGSRIDYAYDANNRLSSIAIPGDGQITYNTYRWNSPNRITLPGGSTAEYTYDPLMQMKELAVKDPGKNLLMAHQYEHSPAGNITAKKTEHGDYGYQYDRLYRLIEALKPGSSRESFTYDAVGNRLTSAGTEGSWSYNENNELLSYGLLSFQYDENGNLTEKSIGGLPALRYVYDVENRLVQVERGDGLVIATYHYDPFGRRLWKEVGGIRTYFLYADEGLIGEYDANGNAIKTYGYAPGSSWTTDPLYLKVGSQTYWYQNDHLGTPQKLIDTSGRVVWSATYDAFGAAQIAISEVENNLRFPGQYYDAETGFHYNWNRYYDPATGRYLSADPLDKG